MNLHINLMIKRKEKKNDHSFYSLTKDFVHAKFMVGLFTLYMDSFFVLPAKQKRDIGIAFSA